MWLLSIRENPDVSFGRRSLLMFACASFETQGAIMDWWLHVISFVDVVTWASVRSICRGIYALCSPDDFARRHILRELNSPSATNYGRKGMYRWDGPYRCFNYSLWESVTSVPVTDTHYLTIGIQVGNKIFAWVHKRGLAAFPPPEFQGQSTIRVRGDPGGCYEHIKQRQPYLELTPIGAHCCDVTWTVATVVPLCFGKRPGSAEL